VKSVDTSIEDEVPSADKQFADIDSLDWEINLSDVRIYDGSFTYYNENSLDTIVFKGINLNSDILDARGSADTLLLKDYNVNGSLNIENAKINKLILDKIKLDVQLDKGVLSIGHQSDGSGGEHNFGYLSVDFTTDELVYSIRQDIHSFRMERFLTSIRQEALIKGEMDFSLSLDFYGKNSSTRWLTSKGEMQLKGENLVLYGINIDMLAKKYARSQKFSMVDIGAFFLAGPLGIAVTKGGELALLLTSGQGDSTEISEFVSVWKVSAGEMYTEDVAFRTAQHRVALQGSLNIWQQHFNALEIALINEHGCAVFHQQVSGSFYEPEVSDVKVVATLLGPVKNIFHGKKCRHVFYSGSVLPHAGGK
jgi:AsmA protein